MQHLYEIQKERKRIEEMQKSKKRYGLATESQKWNHTLNKEQIAQKITSEIVDYVGLVPKS